MRTCERLAAAPLPLADGGWAIIVLALVLLAGVI
jgi:hypothetical protein